MAKPTRLIIEDPSLSSSSSDDSLALTTSGTSTSSAPSTSGKPDFKEPGSKFTEPGTGKDKAGPGDSDGPGSTEPGKGSGQGKRKEDEPTLRNRIFVTAESGAYFDSNGNNKLDNNERDAANAVDFDTLDFTQDAYTVQFIGWGTNGSLLVDLTGFGADDSLIVDFSRGWVGTNLNAANIAFLQRGAFAADGFNPFKGYTFANYTQRRDTDTPNYFAFSQTFTSSSQSLRVGYVYNAAGNVSGFLGKGFVRITFENDLITSSPNRFLPGAPGKSSAKLATWNLTEPNTTVLRTQVSVIFPSNYTGGAPI